MKRIFLLWSVFVFVLSASAQYYYSYSNPIRLCLTDTIVIEGGNPDVDNYLTIDPSLVVSRNNKYTIISDKKMLSRKSTMCCCSHRSDTFLWVLCRRRWCFCGHDR